MAVRHVFAETDVAHQDQARDFAFHRACGLLHDAVVRPGSGGDVVFLLGKAEEDHGGHAERINLLRLFHRLIYRQVEHARHRANFLAYTFPGTNEHGIDKCFRSETGFAHQVAKLRGATKTTKTADRKGHGSLGKKLSAFQLLILAGSGEPEGLAWRRRSDRSV